ncbi:MAG: polysaccharide pyruvyl transferase family protein [Erysipelotrichia bacterium]|nr:polysaccharide pyruvyl transferase family protein [Erysipelotrichia bacterium]
MKIGILTFCNGENFGASLQCYALKSVINELGYDVEVINFYKKAQYGNRWLPSKAKVARIFYEIPYKNSLYIRKKKFEKFNSEMLLIDRNGRVNEESMSEYCKKYNIIIFGSDQIWNLDSRVYDKSKIYFGEFTFIGKKISYAASFGDDIKLAEQNSKYIFNNISKFTSVSVREKTGQKFLNSIGINAVQSPDPTLLLDSHIWRGLIDVNRLIKQDYILYYSVNCRKYSWKVAQRLSEQTGLKVINIVPHPKIIASGFTNYYDVGPMQFLNLIFNSSYVVTNSFHGTVFSIIFKKPFLSVFDEINGKKVLEERKHTLLSELGLLDHEVVMSSNIDKPLINAMENYNFDNAMDILSKMRIDAKEYLKESIDND